MSIKNRKSSYIEDISEDNLNNSNSEINELNEKSNNNNLRNSQIKFNLFRNTKDSIKKIIKGNKLNDISKLRRNSINDRIPLSYSKRNSILSNITSNLSTPKKGELK